MNDPLSMLMYSKHEEKKKGKTAPTADIVGEMHCGIPTCHKTWCILDIMAGREYASANLTEFLTGLLLLLGASRGLF